MRTIQTCKRVIRDGAVPEAHSLARRACSFHVGRHSGVESADERGRISFGLSEITRHRRICLVRFAACILAGVVTLLDVSGRAAPPPPELFISVLAHLDDDAAGTRTALAHKLRRYGTAAHDRLLAMRRLLEQQREQAGDLATRVALTRRIQRLDRLTDDVASQKWSTISGLFWHQDFDRAIRDARQLDRPILSLRVEGGLCGKVRSAEVLMLLAGVYANQELSTELKNHYVLHWQSDLSRSLQAGSLELSSGSDEAQVALDTASPHLAHYLLTTEGVPVAALTRCVSPSCFLKWLREYTSLARQSGGSAGEFAAVLRAAHAASRDRHLQQLQDALRQCDDGSLPTQKLSSMVKRGGSLRSQLSPCEWQQLMAAARRDVCACELDAQSLALIQSDTFVAQARQVRESGLGPSEIERQITADTVRSQFFDVVVIDGCFFQSPTSLDFDLLNAKIYRSCFHTVAAE